MSKRDDLKVWVYEAIVASGGEASPLEVAKHIWGNHEADLRKSELFYTWQYDMRWAAQVLRGERKLGLSPRRRWVIVGRSD
jgi:hypothetical protein